MSTEFSQIRADFYGAWFRYHPEAALDVGVTGFEHLLRPYSDEEQGALVSLNEKLLDALEEIDQSALDADESLDLQLMRGAAFLEMEQILQHDWRRRDPEEFLPLHAIYQLTVRRCEDFASALRQRLTAIPGYLLNARHYIGQEREHIPQPWLESAITAAESGMDYLADLRQHPTVRAHESRLPDLDDLVAGANGAFRRYAKFLDKDVGGRAAGDFAVGPKRFSHLLRYRHFLDVDPDQLYEFGSRLVDRTARELGDLCRRLTGGDDLAALDARIAGGVPEHGIEAAYRRQMEAARDFLRGRDLVSLPGGEDLRVETTPVFLRHRIPFAAYEPPAPGDDPQVGRYFVTPPADAESRARHSALATAHTGVHEGYPGHHLQFVTAHRYPAARSLPRMLNASATLYEGWALYCEQLMRETGFLEQPESEYVLLRDRLWRALRIVLDVAMQTRGMAIEEAAAAMGDRLGFSRTQAVGEATWYSRAPGVPMGYATGWAMINAAREIACPDADPPSAKSFHDALLAHGSCALSLVLERAFGQDLAAQVQARVRDAS